MGFVRCLNPFASGIEGGAWARGLGQLALAPGCIVPGRSVIALFVNTAAMLWFFIYLLWTLSGSWEVVCVSRDPGTAFAKDPMGWLVRGAPSPTHWLLLVFGVTGALLVFLSFVRDLFAAPLPPPRSYYEAAVWRGRRRLTVLSVALLVVLFVGWGVALSYYVFLGDECSEADPSLYYVALLMVLVIVCVVGLLVFFGCCVGLDCLMSGRLKLMLLINGPELDARAAAKATADADATDAGRAGYGTSLGAGAAPPFLGWGGMSHADLLIGAEPDTSGLHMCSDGGGRPAEWSAAPSRVRVNRGVGDAQHV
jgi:hypothetical protein